MRTLLSKFLGVCLYAFFLISCGHTYIYYEKDNRIKAVLTDKRNPPESVVQLNGPDIDNGSWRLDALSASPDAKFLALAYSQWDSFSSKAKLEVYDRFGKDLKFTINSEELRQMIETNSGLDYGDPSPFYLFHPFALGYENEKVLIVDVQPYSREDLTAQDVRLKIDLRTKEVVGTPVFFSRTNRPSFPSHRSKTRYDFEVIDGKMYVNGTLLNNMPSGISERHHDEVTLK